MVACGTRCVSLFYRHLNFHQLAETTDATTDGSSGRSTHLPSTTSNTLATTTALPDAHSLTLNTVLHIISEEKNERMIRRRKASPHWQVHSPYTTAERAGVFAVLGDFDLLDLFAEGGTVTSSVLSHNSNLLSMFGLRKERTGRMDGWMHEGTLARSLGPYHWDETWLLRMTRYPGQSLYSDSVKAQLRRFQLYMSDVMSAHNTQYACTTTMDDRSTTE